MEDLRKRKIENMGNNGQLSTQEELRSLLDPLAKSQLVDLLSRLGSQYPSIAEEIKSIASSDPVHRKLSVRGLAWNTTSETLCTAFRMHGEIEEGAVIYDKATRKSRGYGFITYKHIESTHSALKAPTKHIDGRMAVCNLACEGLIGSSTTPDIAQRKLYIGGLSPDVTSEMLLNYFGRHGEIEEGSVAYDKDTNESRGFRLLHTRQWRLQRRLLMIHKRSLGYVGNTTLCGALTCKILSLSAFFLLLTKFAGLKMTYEPKLQFSTSAVACNVNPVSTIIEVIECKEGTWKLI